MKKVCSSNAIWIFALMLIIPGSVLQAEDPTSTQGQATSTEPIPPALHNALASTLGKAVSVGAKSIPTPPTGSWGIVSEGDGGGGIFRDSDSEAEAWLGTSGYGVEGFGSSAGGYFKDIDGSGYARVGNGDYGIRAYGNTGGGYFEDLDSSGFAYVGQLGWGINGYGSSGGGYFQDTNSTGYAYVGFGDRGIEAYGTEMGGYFADSDGTGLASVAKGDFGIDASGAVAGGLFADSGASGYAFVGNGNYGIRGFGTYSGGYFVDSDNSGYANVGIGNYGIQAFGNATGGYFKDSDQSGYAHVGYGDRGIQAYGTEMGGYFEDSNQSGYAYVGYRDDGIEAYGTDMGGYFHTDGGDFAEVARTGYGIAASGSIAGGFFKDSNTSSNAFVGYGSYKIYGTGAVSFVQNHPYESSSVIVYAAPEGDEVATYTRGTARLIGGEARVPLGETFKWVTNPDIGLTAHLTPREDCNGVYLADISTEEIVVRELQSGTSDCAFDFLVYGLRIGFEESSIVQEKEQESYIPSMADHRNLYERRPDLRTYNSLERFKDMHHAINPKTKLDLSRAQALRDTIIGFDPAVHELPMLPGHEERPVDDLALEEAQPGAVHRVRTARGDLDQEPASDHSDLSATVPVDDEGNIYAPSFRPPSREVATLVDVSESVEPGDVLVIDSQTAGLMRRGFEGHDSGVIGVVLDSRSPALSGEELEVETALHAEVAMAGVVKCKVDATYGAIWPGNLLVSSPTSGHAMRTESPLPGTIVGKALEPLEEGTGTIRVLVMLR